MKKIVKFVVLPLAGVAGIIAATVAYIVATFDPNDYKPQIVQAVKDKTGRTLTLSGDIKLSLFPNIGVALGKASLAEFGTDREFAGIEEFRVSLKLLPLLSKAIVIDTVEIKNLRANLVRGKDGKFSFDDLTGGGNESASVAKNESPPVRIAIANLTLENATITYIDQATGAKYELSKLNLRTGGIASGVPTKIDLSLTAQSDTPKLDLAIAVKAAVSFDHDRQNYVLEGLDVTAKGTAEGISNLVATVKGDVVAKIASQAFLISKLGVTATGRHERGELDFRFGAANLNVTGDKINGEKLALDATLKQAKGEIAARLDIPAIDGSSQAFSASAMTAGINIRQEEATIKANLTSPLSGSINAQRIELGKLAAALNISSPKQLKKPVAVAINGSALIDLAKTNASLIFATRLDDSRISGKAALAKFSPPFYTFDVNIDRIDADRYLLKSDPQQPFELAALKGLNVSGSLTIGSLAISGVKATNARLEIKPGADRAVVAEAALKSGRRVN